MESAMYRLLAPSLLVATLAGSSFPSSAKAEPCSCTDLGDLKNRREEVRVALNVYQSEIERVNGEMMKNRTAIYYTPALAQQIKDKVQAALNQNAAGKLSTAGTGGTDNLCNISVNESATACMQQSTRAHEQVHPDMCLKKRRASSVAASISTPGEFKDPFEVQHVPLVIYAVEETNAYFTEQNFLVAQIQALDGPCKPKPQIQRDYSSQVDQQARRPADPAPEQQVKGAVNSLRR